MCGICGYLTSEDVPAVAPKTLERMVDALVHRGPDDRGTYIDRRCGLGHTRLSIIDLDGGHQPLFNEDETVAVVFNGEIYNFAELREQLIQKGHRFRTNSDTEVLVHLWEEDGPSFVEKLQGMFAFVLYDRKQELLFGARDRFGQKPLFYHWDRGSFAFASEIKGLLPLPYLSRRLDATALDQFLFYQFVPHPRTLFDGVHQLPPGHIFLVEKGQLDISRYWKPSFDPQPSEPDAVHIERLEHCLDEAVASHLVSDVPVGIFLSGGIDSSLIAALASRHSSKRLKSFSIAFPESRYDESRFARLASECFGTEHHEFRFEPKQVAERLESLSATFDQPLADRAAMPLGLLSEKTAAEVKVVLTGDGGDELFAGYEKYQRAVAAPHWARWLDRAVPSMFSSSHLARCQPDRWRLKKLRSRLAWRCLPEKTCSYFKHYWEGWDREKLYTPELAEQVNSQFEALDQRGLENGQQLDPLNRMLRIDETGYLPDDLLLKTDFSTMAFGLEARAPLLDHKLAEVAARLPLHLKATPRQTKIALRQISAKLLPDELVSRPKRGFAVPIRDWFRHDLRNWSRDCLLDSSTSVPKYFRRDCVEKILGEHAEGKRNHASKIYSLLVFELWHRRYLN